MEFTKSELDDLIMFLENEMEESRIKLDEKFGFVFYPCKNTIEEGLEKSMA